MADKYAVVKIEDWNRFERYARVEGLVPPTVDDAVVIRRQDAFAPPALDSYANSIQVAITFLKLEGTEGNLDLIKRLERLADYFHEQAVQSWLTERKLPD